MSGAAQFVAGLANGYGTVMHFKRQSEDDDARREDRENARKDRADADALKADLKTAGDSQSVVAQATDNEDGSPGAPTSFAVNGVKFGTREEADAEATKYNAPTARAARMAGVYEKHGKVNEAMSVRGAAQQQELGALSLTEAQRKHVNQVFDDALSGMGSHDAIAQFVSNSAHDGQGGGLKVQAVPSADGKTIEYQRVDEDGALTPTGLSFANDAQGLGAAQQYLSKNVSAHDKLSNMHQMHMERMTAEQNAATQANQAGHLKLATQQAGEQSRHNRAVEGLEGQRVAVAREAAGAKAGNKADPYDTMEWKSMETERANLSGLINKAKAEGMWNGSPEQKQLESQLAATRMRQNKFMQTYGGRQADADPLGLDKPAAAQGTQPPAQAPAAVPARAPAAAAGVPGAAQQQAAPAQRPSVEAIPGRMTGNATLNQMRLDNEAAITGLHEQAQQAQAMLQAAAKSGDPQSIQRYAQAAQAAQAAVTQEAEKRLGNGASAFLATLQ